MFDHLKYKIDKHFSDKEIVKLKMELYSTDDKTKIKEIKNKIILCECLTWKDYKLYIQ
jgi:hypothetical protein